MPQISIYKNWSKVNNPENIDLLQHLYDIKDGEFEDVVTKARILKEKGLYDEYKAFKDKMQTVSFSGMFESRADSKIVEHSKIIAMDLDIYDHPDLDGVKEKFKSDPHVFSVFLSTSGRGLRVLFRIDPKRHRDAFLGISKYIRDHYDIIVDANSSVSKPYIVSFDPDLYINEKSPVWTVYNKETRLVVDTSVIHTKSDFQEVFERITSSNTWICPEYNDWVELGFALASQFGEGGRSFFHVLSKPDPKYSYNHVEKQFTYCLKSRGSGISINTFYFLAKSAGIKVVSEKTKIIIRTAKNGKAAGLNRDTVLKNLLKHNNITDAEEVVDKIFESDQIKKDKEDQDSLILQLEMFLSNNYSIRLNEVTGYLENNGRQRLTKQDLNSIYVGALKLMPKLQYPLMKRLLESHFIPKYNPFFEFLGSDGTKYNLPATPIENFIPDCPNIDKLCATLDCGNAAYTQYFTRKWIVSIIAAMHGTCSPLFYCLLGGQSLGKTYWFDNLLPHELSKEYYIHSKLDKEKDSEIEMCENILILDDEMYGKSMKESILFNSVSTQQWFSIRRPYGDANEKIMRLAVMCGTSNYLDVLKDPTGNRRVIAIEIFGIDKELYNTIDKAEMLREAYNMYKQGFDWRILGEDIALLNKDQAKYEMSNFEKELLDKYFSVPEKGTKEEARLSTADIVIELKKCVGVPISINQSNLTKEMKRLGYELKTTRIKNSTPKLWLINRENRMDFLPPKTEVGSENPF